MPREPDVELAEHAGGGEEVDGGLVAGEVGEGVRVMRAPRPAAGAATGCSGARPERASIGSSTTNTMSGRSCLSVRLSAKTLADRAGAGAERATLGLADWLDEKVIQDLSGFDRIWLIFAFHLSEGWKSSVKPPRGG